MVNLIDLKLSSKQLEKNNDGIKKYFFIKSNEEDGQFTKKVEQQQNIFVWRWNKQQQMFSVRLTVPRYYL